MSKQTIEWHEGCLRNSEDHLVRVVRQIQSLTEQMKEYRKENNFYRRQINEAKLKGKDGFDRDLFMRNKRDEK